MVHIHLRMIGYLSFFIASFAAVKTTFGQHDAMSHSAFIKSFIKHYESTPEGRYTHEYHPFLLERTAQSFKTLEQRLRDQSFDLSGRMIIFGYEEQAIPSYYTNFCMPKINDEASFKKDAGWSMKLHNMFGIMTGFLFKDVNEINRQYFEGMALLEHVNPESILVFDDRAAIFQEDAFGEFFSIMCRVKKAVAAAYKKGDIKTLFQLVCEYWHILYRDEFKIGTRQVAGTQDILFSIEYLNYLTESPLPCLKFFTGPDITYPIEISSKQKKDATRNAQTFVQQFLPHLQPVDEQNTVYIFCSFVDGVGKSTMLGNIQNSMKHGLQYEQFEHVNNSSSQLCELFQYKDKVFIADMPAQISHFTYKPDGIVFVDAATELPQERLAQMSDYAKTMLPQLESDYYVRLAEAQSVVARGDFFDDAADQGDDIAWFYKNIVLLAKQKTNTWIPFLYQGQWCLCHRERPWDLRVLQDLGLVRSEGLKNIDAEQMHFIHGVRFPLWYNDFVNDLLERLSAQGIKKVIFVDFLSMYPRSSRENVRINFLLQQMALLERSFVVDHSLYRSFVSGGELLHNFQDKELGDAFRSFFALETKVRLALSCCIEDGRLNRSLAGISLASLTPVLRDVMGHISDQDNALITEMVDQKCALQIEQLQKHFGLSKSFVNVQQSNLDDVYLFGQKIEHIFREVLQCDSLNKLWDDVGELLLDRPYQQGIQTDLYVSTTKEKTVRVLYALNVQTKDVALLTPALRLIRARWYLSLCNFLFTQKQDRGTYYLKDEQFWVVPLMLKKDNNGMLYLVEPVDSFTAWNKDAKISTVIDAIYKRFNVDAKHGYFAEFEKRPYLHAWDVGGTNVALYAYSGGCDARAQGEAREQDQNSLVNLWLTKYRAENGGLVYPTSSLYKDVTSGSIGEVFFEQMKALAVASGKLPAHGITAALLGHKTVYVGDEDYKSSIKFFIRLVTTMDMIVKDPDADIVIRSGNQDDYAAALLLFEKCTLPLYFGMYYPDGLFKDVHRIRPYGDA